MKYALITGASRGIGRAIAIRLAQSGYHLYLTCRNRIDLLEQLKKELEKEYSIECSIFTCDVSNPQDIDMLFTHIPSLDLLINNAGISYVGLLHEMDITSWQEVINTNLSSCFYTSRKAIGLMLQNHSGRIINISSVWGSQGASMEVAYSASKGGINSFTRALAKELAPSNIQVNAIACGFIDTEMNENLDAAEKEAVIAEIPADRMGQPDEVAECVQAMLQMPDYYTGQILTLDGAWI